MSHSVSPMQPLLSTEAFFKQVLTDDTRVAVFDCDGTMWSGDAGSGFMRWTIRHGIVSREMVDVIDRRYREYLRGEVSELLICGEMVQMYQGLQEREMRRAAERFFAEEIAGNVFPEMRELLRQLRERGVEIWAVSSTNDWVIEEGVRQFGIEPDRILAARVKVVDGLVTGELVDVPTDEGKAVALRRVGVERPDAVFGNSVHDAAMLSMARRPFAVNPSAALRERAEKEGWAVFLPEAVRQLTA